MLDGQTDVLVWLTDVCGRRTDVRRTLTDGKGTDGYRSLLFTTKIRFRVPEYKMRDGLP
jgi:hypothetical protein